jgi:hypothetical protein
MEVLLSLMANALYSIYKFLLAATYEWKNYLLSCIVAEKPWALRLLSILLKEHDLGIS